MDGNFRSGDGRAGIKIKFTTADCHKVSSLCGFQIYARTLESTAQCYFHCFHSWCFPLYLHYPQQRSRNPLWYAAHPIPFAVISHVVSAYSICTMEHFLQIFTFAEEIINFALVPLFWYHWETLFERKTWTKKNWTRRETFHLTIRCQISMTRSHSSILCFINVGKPKQCKRLAHVFSQQW